MKYGKRYGSTAPIGLAIGMAVLSSAARAEDCSTTLMDAMFAMAKTSYASTIVLTMPGAPATPSEMVVSGAKMYARVNGAWVSSPYSTQDTIDSMTAASKKSKMTCQKVGSETVNGEAATLYADREESKTNTVESRIWISDARGLPLKIESNLGKGASTAQTIRYDGVQPPPGVR